MGAGVTQSGLSISTFEVVSLLLQLLAAIGTFTLAGVAIWSDRVRAWAARPKLIIQLRSNTGELSHNPSGVPFRLYHLVVTNTRVGVVPGAAAVYITSFERHSHSGAWIPSLRSGALRLPWQFGESPEAIGLLTVGRVVNFLLAPEGHAVSLAPGTVQPGNIDADIRANDRVRIKVIAVTEYGSSEPVTIEVNWDGIWEDGDREMSEHLVISELR